MIGAQIFLNTSAGTCAHTGIVYNYDNNKVYTIEGNTNKSDGTGNYIYVAYHEYPINSSKIYGSGYPQF